MTKGEQQTGWKYTGAKKDTGANKTSVQELSWTASEYIAHDKSTSWYIRFAAVSVIGIGLIYLLTRELISVFLLSVTAIAFGFFAARKPNELTYHLDTGGITIGSKFYPISLFRSFAVVEEGTFRSITLLPMKRFMPPISLYYSPDDETALLDTFGSILPQEERQQDALDKFMHRIRF